MTANDADNRLRRLVAELIVETDSWVQSGYPLSFEFEAHSKIRQLNKNDLRSVIYMMSGTAARSGAAHSSEVILKGDCGEDNS